MHAVAQMLGAIAIWSGTPVLLKHFTAHPDPWNLICIRFILAGLVWLPNLLHHRARQLLDPELAPAALAPAAAFGLAHILWNLAPYHN